MKYSTYFGHILKQSGVPRLSYNQFQRMMNIVVLEAEIRGMQKMREHYTITDKTRHLISMRENKLSDLTRNLPPDKLMRELVQGSGDVSYDRESSWSEH